MATPLPDAPQSGENDGSDVQTVEQPNENFDPEIEEKFKSLRNRERPVTIVVIGPAGADKSTLINAMFGISEAKVGHGARSFISEFQGKYNGVKVKVYDTVGFRDTGGESTLKNIAKLGTFDLILICLKLGDRVDRHVFSSLASVLNKEMWKRTIVVLTQANRLDNDLEDEIRREIDEYKACVHEFLSKSVRKEVLEKIPFCIAGRKWDKTLPTAGDWEKKLWDTCIDRCDTKALPFITFYTMYMPAIIQIAAVFIGVIAGTVFGSIVPNVGTILGAGIGGGVGGFIGATIIRILKNNSKNI